jgi:hypothetical protein
MANPAKIHSTFVYAKCLLVITTDGKCGRIVPCSVSAATPHDDYRIIIRSVMSSTDSTWGWIIRWLNVIDSNAPRSTSSNQRMQAVNKCVPSLQLFIVHYAAAFTNIVIGYLMWRHETWWRKPGTIACFLCAATHRIFGVSILRLVSTWATLNHLRRLPYRAIKLQLNSQFAGTYFRYISVISNINVKTLGSMPDLCEIALWQQAAWSDLLNYAYSSRT